jgi:hypothetical protein
VALLIAVSVLAGACKRPHEGSAMPRLADGHPDLTGIWVFGNRPQHAQKADGSTEVYLRVPGLDPDSPTVFKGLDQITVDGRAAAPNKPQYKPELQGKVKELSDLQSKLDPAFFCRPPGIPRIGPPNQIIHIPGQVVLLYESQNAFRVIATDGRPHRTDVDPSYFGDSVGHWEGATLIVDVNAITEDTWLGSDGYFHSPAMRVIERFERFGDNLRYTATVDDPNVLTQPWTMNPRTLRLSKDPEDALVESPPCIERDAPHMTTTEHH